MRWSCALSTRHGANTCAGPDVVDHPAQSKIPAITREAFEVFLIRESRLLDERRFRDWMNLFTDDGTYWVPAVPGQESPHNQASLFYDDRQLMKTRIDRLEHPLIHVQTPPSQTVHLVGGVLDRIRRRLEGRILGELQRHHARIPARSAAAASRAANCIACAVSGTSSGSLTSASTW